jgi:glutathione S-transferase
VKGTQLIKVHHLGISQSERIVWQCEELNLDYQLLRYDRDPVSRRAPLEYKALSRLGIAPVIEDGDLVLGESGAIVEYISRRYANGRLIPGPGDAGFVDFLFWFHFANGTLVPSIMMDLSALRLGLAAKPAATKAQGSRTDGAYDAIEQRLGEAAYMAGDEFTAADIMMFFPLTTMRFFAPRDLTPYPNVRAYVRRVGERPAYRRAMAKADPDFAPLLS